MNNRIIAIAFILCAFVTTNVYAQNTAAPQLGPSSSVTGSITPEGAVRMIARGEVLQIHMEIFSTSGELVSDSGIRLGNVIDWKRTDAAQPLTDGAYVVVVTVKDFKGNQHQRMSSLRSMIPRLSA
jgi:uncharacterized protein YraI